MGTLVLAWDHDPLAQQRVAEEAVGAAARVRWMTAARGACTGLAWVFACPRRSGQSPAWVEADGYVLFLDGDVYLDDSPDAASPTGTAIPVARRLLQRFLTKGPDGLVGLNGSYNATVWHAATETAIVANDLLGVRPFFYWTHPGGFCLGSPYRSFLAHPRFRRELDPAALSDLLVLGYPIRDATLLRDVRRLPPGTALAIQPGRVQSVTQRVIQFTDVRWATPCGTLVAEYDHLLLEAVRRRAPASGTPLLPLSGGLDSRTVAGLAVRSGIVPDGLTYGSPRHIDVAVARRVAKPLRMPLQVVPLPRDFPWSHASEHVATVEGGSEILTGYWFAMVDTVEDRYPVILSGFMGDATSGAHIRFGRLEDGGSDDAVFERAFRYLVQKEGGVPPSRLGTVLHPDLFRAAKDATRERSRQGFTANGIKPFQHLMYWDFMGRQRFWIGSHLAIQELCGRVCSPFTDLDVLRFVASLPALALDGQYLYRQRLIQFDPRLARIIYANEKAPLTPSLPEQLWQATWMRLHRGPLPRLLDRLQTRTTDAGIPQTEMWSPIYGGRPAAGQAVVQRLRKELALFFTIQALDELLAPRLDPSRFHLLRKVVTFALWHEQYLGRPSPYRLP